jgi:dipeptidyl aminopeptidase/acylaminoacyl peptidase
LTRSEQFMHSAGAETREVYDRYSDLALIDTLTGEMSSSSVIADHKRIETFPAWSADGRYLYFCSALIHDVDPSLPQFVGSESVRYDLMRISFDPETRAWGKLETVLTAGQAGGSISEPRTSPDGRFLVFCRSDHGAFQVLQPDCDLYIVDLTRRNEFPFRPLAAANSPRTDSWHSWSSNSRWLVFSSKRDYGLFARPYITYIDRDGHESKPLVMPQEDPLFYDSYLKTYNVPELVQGPVRVSEQELSRAIHAAASPETVENHATDAVAPN